MIKEKIMSKNLCPRSQTWIASGNCFIQLLRSTSHNHIKFKVKTRWKICHNVIIPRLHFTTASLEACTATNKQNCCIVVIPWLHFTTASSEAGTATNNQDCCIFVVPQLHFTVASSEAQQKKSTNIVGSPKARTIVEKNQKSWLWHRNLDKEYIQMTLKHKHRWIHKIRRVHTQASTWFTLLDYVHGPSKNDCYKIGSLEYRLVTWAISIPIPTAFNQQKIESYSKNEVNRNRSVFSSSCYPV